MKQYMLATTIALGILGVGTAQAANAQTANTRDSQRMNTNNSQVAKQDRALFQMLDSDNDGQLSKQELSNLQQIVARQVFENTDIDNNGKITQAEYLVQAQRRALKIFGMIDQDQSGTINKDEITQSGQGGQGSRPRTSGPNAAKARTSAVQTLVEKMDTNNDDKISRQEWYQGVGTSNRGNTDRGSQKAGQMDRQERHQDRQMNRDDRDDG